MQKQLKKPLGMDMKKKVNTLKFVLVALLVLHGTSALGQDKIDEIQNTVGKTIVRNQDSSHYIVCHQSEQWDPYFSIIDENDNDVKQCIIPKEVVKEVTDFVVKGNDIYLCGQLYEDSVWFIGRINITNFSENHPALFDYFKLYYASKLTKLQYESDRWFVVGNDTNGNALLVEAFYFIDPYNPIFGVKSYYVSLVDTSSNLHYNADDIIVMENYIAVSSHVESVVNQIIPLKEGRLWFILNPLNPVFSLSHITYSQVSYSDMPYKTTRPVFLAKMNGTQFYASGTSEFLINRNATISWYIEREHQKTVTLSDWTTSIGIAYNPASNNVDMLAGVYTGRIPINADYDRIYSFNRELIIGNTAYGRQYDLYKLNSLIANPLFSGQYVVTGEDKVQGYPYHNYFIRYKRGLWNACTTKISSAVTKKTDDITTIKTVNYHDGGIHIRNGVYATCLWTNRTQVCE